MRGLPHGCMRSRGVASFLCPGDKLKIVDVYPAIPGSSGIVVTFKGFVGNWKNNTGEDRGYTIDTGSKLMKRYSLHKKGKAYEIVATRGDHILGRLVVRLTPPGMDYIVLKINDHRHIFLRPEDTVSLSRDDKIGLEAIQTNLYSKKGIHLNINGNKIKPGDMRELRKLNPSQGHLNQQVQIKKGSLVLGRIFLRMN